MSLWRVITQTVNRVIADDCSGMAAEAAYSFVLSFFPFLLLLASCVAVFGADRGTIDAATTTLQRFMPTESHALIQSYIKSLYDDSGSPSSVFSLSLILLFWTASSVLSTLMKGLNRAYHIEPDEQRPYWKDKLISLALVPITIVPIQLAGVLALISGRLAALLDRELGLGIQTSWLWASARWALVGLVVASISGVIYYVGPNKKQRILWIMPGSLLASALWLGSSILFNLYVSRYGSYNRVYGGLGAFIVLLLWMYLTSLAFLVGGEFNAVLEYLAKQRSGNRVAGESQVSEEQMPEPRLDLTRPPDLPTA